MKNLIANFNTSLFNFLRTNEFEYTLVNDETEKLTLISFIEYSCGKQIMCADPNTGKHYMYDIDPFCRITGDVLRIKFSLPYEPGDILKSRSGSIFMWDGKLCGENMSAFALLLPDDNIDIYSGKTVVPAVDITNVSGEASDAEIKRFLKHFISDCIESRNEDKLNIYNKYIKDRFEGGIDIQHKIELSINSCKPEDFDFQELVLCKNKNQPIYMYRLCEFAFYNKKDNMYHVVGGNTYDECIPYIDNEEVFEHIKSYYNE